MNPLQFLTFFLLLTIAGTLAVTGWYFITRGEEETRPDGSKKRVGKIFKGWYFFWTREMPLKKVVFYKNEELQKLLKELSDNYPYLVFTTIGETWFKIIDPAYDYYQDKVQKVAPLIAKLLPEMAEKWELKIMEQSALHNFEAYKLYPQYVFPEWVRSPLAECATCFASVYGSAFYWLVIAMVKEPLFAWSNGCGVTAIFFWIVFCLQLAVLNTALAKRFN